MQLDPSTNPVRVLRLRRKWTLSQLADRSGLNLQSIWQIEVGRRWPRPRTLVKLAFALRACVIRLVWRMQCWGMGAGFVDRDPRISEIAGPWFSPEVIRLVRLADPETAEGDRLLWALLDSGLLRPILYPWQ